MRMIFLAVMVLGVAAHLAGPAAAQLPGGGLLQNKSVQEELKLDDAQIKKINEAQKKILDENKDSVAKLLDPKISLEEKMEIGRKLNEANVAAVKDILKPEQMARFKQIQLSVQSQFAGIGVFADPEVQKALKLTDEQKTSMKKIADEARKELEGLGGLKPENFLKARAIQKQSFEKAVTLLTEDQKKAWKDLLGKPFELKLDIPRPPQ